MLSSEIAGGIQELPFFTALRESALVYPIVLSCHLSGIALFGGAILMTNLRRLGLALTGRPEAEIRGAVRPWKAAGLLVMLTTGALLAGAKFEMYYANPYFQLKLALLALVLLNGAILRGKTAACFSLVLWLGIISAGRLIAYYEPPAAQARGLRPDGKILRGAGFILRRSSVRLRRD